MGRFTLRLPKTLHTELNGLAKSEGISLNQYIVYALTQKTTAERLARAGEHLISEQAKLLDNVKTVSSGQVAEQYKDYEALLSQLGPEATDEQVEKYLSERERVEPAADLEREAVMRLKEKVMQARQIALR